MSRPVAGLLAAAALLAALLAGGLTGSGPAVAKAPCAEPGAVSQPVPWAQKLLMPDRVWPLATGGGITVAVLDSGVDGNHPQLAGRVLPGRDFLYTKGGPANRDCVGHGTAVASIIAARGAEGTGFRGMAPDARILPMAVSEKQGDGNKSQGRAVTPAEFANAVRVAVADGAKVINVSAVFDADHPEVREAIRFAIDSDVVVVAAVGNSARDGNPTPFPAAYDDVVGVGGIDERGEALPESGYGSFVDLVAPGDAVVAATPPRGHASWHGTSFAAPFVSAVAALVRQYWSQLNARQVAQRLTATASPAPGGPRSPRYGYGVVDAYRAVTERLVTAWPPATREPVRRQVDPAAAARARELRELTRVALVAGAMAAALALAAVIAGAVHRAGRRRRWRPARAAPASPPEPERDDAPVGLFDDLISFDPH